MNISSMGNPPPQEPSSSSSLPSQGTIYIPDLIDVLLQPVDHSLKRYANWENELFPLPAEMIIKDWDLPPGYTRTNYSDWVPENPIYSPNWEENPHALDPVEGYEQEEMDGILERMAERNNNNEESEELTVPNTSANGSFDSPSSSNTATHGESNETSIPILSEVGEEQDYQKIPKSTSSDQAEINHQETSNTTSPVLEQSREPQEKLIIAEDTLPPSTNGNLSLPPPPLDVFAEYTKSTMDEKEIAIDEVGVNDTLLPPIDIDLSSDYEPTPSPISSKLQTPQSCPANLDQFREIHSPIKRRSISEKFIPGSPLEYKTRPAYRISDAPSPTPLTSAPACFQVPPPLTSPSTKNQVDQSDGVENSIPMSTDGLEDALPVADTPSSPDPSSPHAERNSPVAGSLEASSHSPLTEEHPDVPTSSAVMKTPLNLAPNCPSVSQPQVVKSTALSKADSEMQEDFVNEESSSLDSSNVERLLQPESFQSPISPTRSASPRVLNEDELLGHPSDFPSTEVSETGMAPKDESRTLSDQFMSKDNKADILKYLAQQESDAKVDEGPILIDIDEEEEYINNQNQEADKHREELCNQKSSQQVNVIEHEQVQGKVGPIDISDQEEGNEEDGEYETCSASFAIRSSSPLEPEIDDDDGFDLKPSRDIPTSYASVYNAPESTSSPIAHQDASSELEASTLDTSFSIPAIASFNPALNSEGKSGRRKKVEDSSQANQPVEKPKRKYTRKTDSRPVRAVTQIIESEPVDIKPSDVETTSAPAKSGRGQKPYKHLLEKNGGLGLAAAKEAARALAGDSSVALFEPGSSRAQTNTPFTNKFWKRHTNDSDASTSISMANRRANTTHPARKPPMSVSTKRKGKGKAKEPEPSITSDTEEEDEGSVITDRTTPSTSMSTTRSRTISYVMPPPERQAAHKANQALNRQNGSANKNKRSNQRNDLSLEPTPGPDPIALLPGSVEALEGSGDEEPPRKKMKAGRADYVLWGTEEDAAIMACWNGERPLQKHMIDHAYQLQRSGGFSKRSRGAVAARLSTIYSQPELLVKARDYLTNNEAKPKRK